MDWTTSTIVPAFTIVFWGLIRTAPELRDMAKIEAAIATLEKHFDVIEQALAHQLTFRRRVRLRRYSAGSFATPVRDADRPPLAAGTWSAGISSCALARPTSAA